MRAGTQAAIRKANLLGVEGETMDRNAFDGLTKLLGASPNRRAALGALFGAGLAGTLGAADAARKDRKRRKAGKKRAGATEVSAQAADCLNPGPSSNISGCPFQNANFSGDDLSGSRMVATNFRDADLARTNLSSSNARNAIFREADLTCANLRSSTLGGADFRAANLTLATLKSSGGCNSATFNAATTFCATTMCDGSVRNDDCVDGGPPPLACCDPAQRCATLGGEPVCCPSDQTCGVFDFPPARETCCRPAGAELPGGCNFSTLGTCCYNPCTPGSQDCFRQLCSTVNNRCCKPATFPCQSDEECCLPGTCQAGVCVGGPTGDVLEAPSDAP